MNRPQHSPVWPFLASDPRATTLLTADDFIAAGGGAALRDYLSARLAFVAVDDPDTPRRWSSFATRHLAERAGDQTDGGAEVAAAALQMALAYIAYLEGLQAPGGGQ